MRWIVAILMGVACAASSAELLAEPDEFEKTRTAWNAFFDNIPSGTPEEKVRQLMDKKYRDVGYARENNEVYCLLFLIDDYHQVKFMFNNKSRLIMGFSIEPKTQWLRQPSGLIRSIPFPAEAALRAKADEVAIQYVAEKAQLDRGTLKVLSRRSEKNQTWNCTVTIDDLQVDSPNFLLEVTDEGQVKEIRPIAPRPKNKTAK